MSARRAAAILLAAAALWQIGAGVYIPLKAALAQILISRAWAEALRGDAASRAWPWADFSPASRLRVAQRGVDLIVLGDASGRSLAFGPGWMTAEPWRGEGVAAIAGHRDTHFSFVHDLRPGDTVELQDRRGRWHRYRIDGTTVVDPADGPLRVDCAQECVALVTCERQRSAGGDEPLRLVVTAARVERTAQRAATPAMPQP